MTRIHRADRRTPFDRDRKRGHAAVRPALQNLTATLMNALFARWPERFSSGLVRVQRLTAQFKPTGRFYCRGLDRAMARRMFQATGKAATATSEHGRKLAARAIELARGEMTATERAFRRLGFGWKA